MKDKILKITYGGILSAVVMLATYAIKIPIPNSMGYFNLGDGVIFGIAAILGPFAAITAGLGSALADLAYSVPIYIPATFLIKGAMGFLSGMILMKKPDLRWFWQIILFAACEIIMIGGYFLYEYLLFDLSQGKAGYALAALPLNSLQGVAGIALGLAIVPLARRIKLFMKL
jgi:uncharacterized membrane protein